MQLFPRRKEPYIPNRSFLKILLAMKLTALLLLIACVHVSGNGFSQKIVLSAKDMPLSNVFKSIEQQSGYTFFYDNRVIRDADHVTGDFQGNSPKQILDAVLKNQSLTYEIVDKIIVIRSNTKPPTPSTNSSQSLRPNVPKSSLPVSERKKEPMVELSEKMLLTLISEITVRGVV